MPQPRSERHDTPGPLHADAAAFLRAALASGTLGTGRAEQDPSPSALHALHALRRSVPRLMLAAQFLWSTLVVGLAHHVSNTDGHAAQDAAGGGGVGGDTLRKAFWSSRLSVAPSVLGGVGWALFVLLAFYLREASARHTATRTRLSRFSALLAVAARHLLQQFSRAQWHDRDQDRIAAHLIAAPLALHMQLRGERDRAPLRHVLCPRDVDDVLAAPCMLMHCMNVVRAYLYAAEPFVIHGFQTSRKPIAGPGARTLAFVVVDDVDVEALGLMRDAEFRPSVAYVNHLKIFLYIWLSLLPLSLVATSGWFTVLFSMLITYGVGMLFYIASALDNPFGYDDHDIELNRIAAQSALSIMSMFSSQDISLTNLIRVDHQTPNWLETALPDCQPSDKKKPHLWRTLLQALVRAVSRSLQPQALVPLLSFVAWTAFVVFFTWSTARHREQSTLPTCRWWCLYIPMDSVVTSYVSLGVFVLLSFWMADAYGRYWDGLQIWQTDILPVIDQVVFAIGIVAKRAMWHPRDRERLFSHFVALPYAAKLTLRNSRDLAELIDILSPRDLQALDESDHMVFHCFNVIHAYWGSLEAGDKDTNQSAKNPCVSFGLVMPNFLLKLENDFARCESIRNHGMPQSVTTHLRIFTVIWLALLPLSAVEKHGFFSFLYLFPIAFSLISMLTMGKEFADPFGTDRFDIPLDTFCTELKHSVHETYNSLEKGRAHFVHASDYSADNFTPRIMSHEFVKSQGTHNHPLTLLRALKKSISHLPSVPIRPMLFAIYWSVAAVMVSWGLSHLWSEEKRDVCRAWCSPIDVENRTLENIGFALFLILAFRASDAMERYQRGAENIFKLQGLLRSLALDFCWSFKDGLYHEADKEKVVAHLIQIPLCLRDVLLGKGGKEARPSILSTTDQEAFDTHPFPLEHLIRTVEAYALMYDMPDAEEALRTRDIDTSPALRVKMVLRMRDIRKEIYSMLAVKRFPISWNYVGHQRLFTSIWLFLLPLGMSSTTGFYTILWAPIISYGVLGLENIAVKLVDPFGDDDIDIPIDKLCREASENVLEAVLSSDWDCTKHTTPRGDPCEPYIGTKMDSMAFYRRRSLPHFEGDKSSVEDFGTEPVPYFRGSEMPKIKPSLFGHFLHSVPWTVLLGIVAWATLGTVISYVARFEENKQRWWTSRIIIDQNVGKYTSFAAFLLLSLYVRAAYERYQDAGYVWFDRLPKVCHILASTWPSCVPSDAIHKGDHDRVLGHIAAVPIVLKHELRDSKDISELKGLLSKADIASILCAPNMSWHCLDVIRSYYMEVSCHQDRLHDRTGFFFGPRMVRYQSQVDELEETLWKIDFLHKFSLSPAFIAMLNILIVIWVLLLPFILAESSGWFTILWVSLIGYGILGMHAIACELQQPFGTDLNDLDLDSIADGIVQDILFVQMNQKNGASDMIVRNDPHPTWSCNSEIADTGKAQREGRFRKHLALFLQFARLAVQAVPVTVIVASAIWATLATAGSWLVSRHWELPEGLKECDKWWCSRIAINADVKEYMGYPLFLLLAFRLYDSHFRYVHSLVIWQDRLIGGMGLFSNRVFMLYKPGSWHEGDVGRLAGHMAAFGVMLIGKLRGKNNGNKLREVVCEADAVRIERAHSSVYYCMDVIAGYLADSDRKLATNKPRETCSPLYGRVLMIQMNFLENQAQGCLKLVKVPLPFGYTTHLKVMLFLWILLLPLGLVESSGWVTILWVVVVTYGVVGIERWAEQLCDASGCDVSDVPLDDFCDRFINTIKTNMAQFVPDGSASLIFQDRGGFPRQGDEKDVTILDMD